VVLVQNLFGALEVEIVVAPLVPGKLRKGLQVGSDDLILHRFTVHPAESIELSINFLASLFGKLETGQQLLQLGKPCVAVIHLTELILNGLQLLAENHLSLAVPQLLLYFRLDVLLRIQNADLTLQMKQYLPKPLFDRQRFEQGLSILMRYLQISGDQIGQTARVFRTLDDLFDDFFRESCLRPQLCCSFSDLSQERYKGVVGQVRWRHLFGLTHDGLQIAFRALADSQGNASIFALQQELHASGHSLQLPNTGHGPNGMQTLG
jgi:hypothetical protein